MDDFKYVIIEKAAFFRPRPTPQHRLEKDGCARRIGAKDRIGARMLPYMTHRARKAYSVNRIPSTEYRIPYTV